MDGVWKCHVLLVVVAGAVKKRSAMSVMNLDILLGNVVLGHLDMVLEGVFEVAVVALDIVIALVIDAGKLMVIA